MIVFQEFHCHSGFINSKQAADVFNSTMGAFWYCQIEWIGYVRIGLIRVGYISFCPVL